MKIEKETVKIEKSTLFASFENNVKGAFAEQLAKEMFIASGYEVFNYGIEYIVPGFKPRESSIIEKKNKTEKKDFKPKCEVASLVEKVPDFLVRKDGKAHLVEVKFRSSGEHDIKENYPFPKAKFLIFSPFNIRINLQDKNGSMLLREHNDCFKFDEAVISSAEKLLRRYFGNNEEFSDSVKNLDPIKD